MTTTQILLTADQLFQASNLGRCELVRGEVVPMSPAGFEHGRIVSRLNSRLEQFVEASRLGIVTGAETGFRIEERPDTVRAPDVGFVRQLRVPRDPVRGYFPGAPDLAVEVLSPDDRASEVAVKVQQWLAAGCVSVWVVDPASQSITRYAADGTARIFSPGDKLIEELLPGFFMAIEDVFRR